MTINIRDYKESPYDFYLGKLKFKKDFFSLKQKNDILKDILSKKGGLPYGNY